MGYLQRGRDRRADPTLVLPGAQSVFCVGKPYPAQPHGSLDPAHGPRFARYIHGRDYHLSMAEELTAIANHVASKQSAPLRFKVCVDSSAILERTWGALAGLGWIGKNTLLIHPQFGSYFLIGVILLDQPLNREPQPLANYCGSCERCLQGCPTQAFQGPGILDSRRCISYQTLEYRGELDASQAPPNGTWVAGCDVCQEVCPFNQKVSRKATPVELDPFETWRALLEETPEDYQKRVKNTALSRIKPAQWDRNLAQAFLYALRSSPTLRQQDWVKEVVRKRETFSNTHVNLWHAVEGELGGFLL